MNADPHMPKTLLRSLESLTADLESSEFRNQTEPLRVLR